MTAPKYAPTDVYGGGQMQPEEEFTLVSMPILVRSIIQYKLLGATLRLADRYGIVTSRREHHNVRMDPLAAECAKSGPKALKTAVPEDEDEVDEVLLLELLFATSSLRPNSRKNPHH